MSDRTGTVNEPSDEPSHSRWPHQAVLPLPERDRWALIAEWLCLLTLHLLVMGAAFYVFMTEVKPTADALADATITMTIGQVIPLLCGLLVRAFVGVKASPARTGLMLATFLPLGVLEFALFAGASGLWPTPRLWTINLMTLGSFGILWIVLGWIPTTRAEHKLYPTPPAANDLPAFEFWKRTSLEMALVSLTFLAAMAIITLPALSWRQLKVPALYLCINLMFVVRLLSNVKWALGVPASRSRTIGYFVVFALIGLFMSALWVGHSSMAWNRLGATMVVFCGLWFGVASLQVSILQSVPEAAIELEAAAPKGDLFGPLFPTHYAKEKTPNDPRQA